MSWSTVQRILIVCSACALPACAAAIKPTVAPSIAASRMEEFWQPPVDISSGDLRYGPWGAANAPNPDDTYTFVRKKRQGTNPGLTARDSRGREWHVKQGVEAQPEVVLSHVLAAVGYHQPPVYYLPSFTLVDESGRHQVTGGRFRLDAPGLKDVGSWSWDENPFIGTRPYQGLLVMLVMFNSADLKNVNNTIYQVDQRDESQQWFVVRDLGSSLGETGRFNPKENRLDVFERHGFVAGVRDGFVEFDYHAIHGNLVRGHIRPEDVRWASEQLMMLTAQQWQDAFTAAGYSNDVSNRFIRRLHEKIDMGLQFPAQHVATPSNSREQQDGKP